MCRSSRTCFQARVSADRCSGRQATKYSAWAYPIPICYQRPEASLARPLFTHLGDGLDGFVNLLPTVERACRTNVDTQRATNTTVLNIALGKYQPAESEPILVGCARLLKPALRLLTLYRLRIDQIRDGKAVASYTR
jgi:hypothetical protein